MPIQCPVSVTSLNPDEFEALDYRVMGQAYACQNELGRLCDECAYHADLRVRLLADGFHSVLTEVPVTVTHQDFSKKYFLDLIADGALYELKAENHLVGEHESQLLNYVFLMGIHRGKLLNFRPPKVQGKIVATSLTPADRRRFGVDAGGWHDLSPACVTLRSTLLQLLDDWGAFLDLALYREALIHFLGGSSNLERHVSLHRDGLDLGGQRMFVHAPGLAFRITAFKESQRQIESHLRRLLAITELKAIQWINLNNAQIEFTTISSDEN